MAQNHHCVQEDRSLWEYVTIFGIETHTTWETAQETPIQRFRVTAVKNKVDKVLESLLRTQWTRVVDEARGGCCIDEQYPSIASVSIYICKKRSVIGTVSKKYTYFNVKGCCQDCPQIQP